MDATSPNLISQALAAGDVARRLALRGDVHLALGLLCQALRLTPEAPVLDAAEGWLTEQRLQGVGRRPLRKLALALADLAAKAAREGAVGDGCSLNLRAASRLLERVRRCYPDEGNLYVSEAFVLDKLGDQVGKARVFRDAARHFPSNWKGHGMMVALARSTAA